MGINDSERIYPSAKEIAIKNINMIDVKVKPLKREKVINFNTYKKTVVEEEALTAANNKANEYNYKATDVTVVKK